MDSGKFLNLCKQNEHADKTDNKILPKIMYLLFGIARHCRTTRHC